MSEKEVYELRRAHAHAAQYLGMIGRPETHLSGSCGRIHALNVQTEITYQAAPGEKNYWEDAVFDQALAKVIRRRFKELADEAVSIMNEEYIRARVAQKKSLLEQLKEIEALEAREA